MRPNFSLLALMALCASVSAAQAQRYDSDDDEREPPSRYDRDGSRDEYRSRRFVCLLDPAPNAPGRVCETRPGRPGSPCRCGGPYFGHREIDRRD